MVPYSIPKASAGTTAIRRFCNWTETKLPKDAVKVAARLSRIPDTLSEAELMP